MSAVPNATSRMHGNGLASRSHAGFWAFVVQRVSGLALAVFLPVHFWVLGKALQGDASLDGFLHWTDQPLVKAAEVILVVLLAAHLAGGLRVLVIEGMAWRGTRKNLVAVAGGVALAVGLLFALATRI